MDPLTQSMEGCIASAGDPSCSATAATRDFAKSLKQPTPARDVTMVTQTPKTPPVLRTLPSDLERFRVFRADVRVSRCVGTGRTSRVHKATWRNAHGDQDVVLKHAHDAVAEITLDTLKEGRCMTPSERADAERALLKEASVLARIAAQRHSHIANLLGVVADEAGIALVLEWGAWQTAADVFVSNPRSRAHWTRVRRRCVSSRRPPLPIPCTCL